MNKLLTALLASTLLTLPVAADGYEFEVGYSRLNASEGDVDVNLGSIYGVAGYRWDHGENYSSSAELSLALNTDNTELLGELTSRLAAGYKGTWQTSSDDTQLFWRANYTQFEITSDGDGGDTSSREGDIGIGVGIVWKRVTLGYTTFLGDLDDFDFINIGFKF